MTDALSVLHSISGAVHGVAGAVEAVGALTEISCPLNRQEGKEPPLIRRPLCAQL